MLQLPVKPDEAGDLLANLESNLFTSGKERRGGAKTYLNVNCLYDLFWYIRRFELSRLEQCCVIDYQVQVFLIEMVQCRDSYSSVLKVVHRILDEIRSDPCYWVEESEVYRRVAKLKEEKIAGETQLNGIAHVVQSEMEQVLEVDNKKKTGKEGKRASKAITSGKIESEPAIVKVNKRGRKSKAQPIEAIPVNQNQQSILVNTLFLDQSNELEVKRNNEPYEHQVTIKTAKAEIGILKPDEALAIYKKYIDRASLSFPKSCMADLHTIDESLIDLRESLVSRSPTDMAEVNLITQGFLKEIRKVKNVVSSENRYTRNMRKTTKSEDYEKLKFEYERAPEGLGKRLRLDIMDCMPLNYRDRILFNPKFFPYTKLKLVFLPRIYNFLLKSVGVREVGHFGLILQNFLMFLNQSSSPIEIYSSDTKMCKGISVDQLREQINVRNTKHLVKFVDYCKNQTFLLEDSLEKVLSTRKVQLAFLENILRLGRSFIKAHLSGAIHRPRLHRTFSSLEKSHQRQRLRLTGPEKSHLLGKLESIFDLNKGLADDLAAFSYKVNESQMSSSCRETLHQYTCLVEKRMKMISNDPGVADYLSKNVHSNRYDERGSEITAIKRYQNYVEHPETKEKLSYRFYGEKEFKLPMSGYKKFAQSYLRWHTKQVINNRIAQEVGDGVSVSQVRHLKHKFVKELAKRAAKNDRALKDQLTAELANFDFTVMFNWLNQGNIAS